MLWVDVNYTLQLAPLLRNFKRKSEYLFNCSCPYCGDSQANKIKARLYIFQLKDKLLVKCHNCGINTTISNLIKFVSPSLYDLYNMEKFKESSYNSRPPEQTIPKIFKTEITDAILDRLKRVDTLPPKHPVVKFCLDRMIPRQKFNLLYVTPKFKKYVNSILANKFSSLEDDHPRLIIPFFNQHGKCFAFSGRAFGPQQPKYFTIKLDDLHDRIYGLERINYSKHIYIVEGQIDSLFLPNCLAVSGSSFFNPVIKSLQSNCTLVYDREPRSPELTKLILNTIKKGFKICLLPETMPGKDINEYIMAGMTSQEIIQQIDTHSFQGLSAHAEFIKWRKC